MDACCQFQACSAVSRGPNSAPAPPPTTMSTVLLLARFSSAKPRVRTSVASYHQPMTRWAARWNPRGAPADVGLRHLILRDFVYEAVDFS